jgi:NADH:ubiquinone oxidoreductase subunit 5 (subunit L)/multisubunit Na+/H+ antiporter MnhA subunit
MQHFMPLYAAIPFLGFFISLIFHRTQEKAIARLALATVGLHFLLVLYGVWLWFDGGRVSQHLAYWNLFEHDGFKFILHFYFDGISAVFAIVGAVISLLVVRFSQFYMHRDEGFKRYFNSLLLFYTGYSFAVFAGNFETLFIGWEIFGFTSFLLIAYFRDRYLPIKNAFKVLSVYRLGDVCFFKLVTQSHGGANHLQCHFLRSVVCALRGFFAVTYRATLASATRLWIGHYPARRHKRCVVLTDGQGAIDD